MLRRSSTQANRAVGHAADGVGVDGVVALREI
jgi:hypothetical protein